MESSGYVDRIHESGAKWPRRRERSPANKLLRCYFVANVPYVKLTQFIYSLCRMALCISDVQNLVTCNMVLLQKTVELANSQLWRWISRIWAAFDKVFAPLSLDLSHFSNVDLNNPFTHSSWNSFGLWSRRFSGGISADSLSPSSFRIAPIIPFVCAWVYSHQNFASSFPDTVYLPLLLRS
jgi:hypothetical protein